MIVQSEYYSFTANKDLEHRGFLENTTKVFCNHGTTIDSSKDDNNEERMDSNSVLEIVAPDLLALGWDIEKGKRSIDKIRIPISEKKEKNPDGLHKESKTILEVEGPRAWVANAWSKDLIKVLQTKQDYLVLVVRRLYGGRKDFEAIKEELASIKNYPLKGILLIGY